MVNKCVKPIILICLVGLFNVLYFVSLKVFCKNPGNCDFLNYRIFNMKNTNCCSMWPISHFLLYFILGIFFPECGIPLIIFGVAWEGIEILGGTLEAKKRKKRGQQYSEKYWMGSVADLIANPLGFICGYFLQKLLKKNEKNYSKEETEP